jgi:hypothetical protein
MRTINTLPLNANERERLVLEPVMCSDCKQTVPLGWVEYGTVRCADNVGANGVQYGHRVPSYVYDHLLDRAFNNAEANRAGTTA